MRIHFILIAVMIGLSLVLGCGKREKITAIPPVFPSYYKKVMMTENCKDLEGKYTIYQTGEISKNVESWGSKWILRTGDEIFQFVTDSDYVALLDRVHHLEKRMQKLEEIDRVNYLENRVKKLEENQPKGKKK